MAQPLGRAHLDSAVSTIRRDIRDVVTHFNKSQGKQTEWLKREFREVREQFQIVNTKLDAIMSGEVLVTRKQLERLLRALKAKGIELDEAEILAA